MPSRDARIDAYIARSAEFARPILTHLRGVVHAGCPEVAEVPAQAARPRPRRLCGSPEEETRARRLAQAVKWLADGKSRNWKYSNR